MTLQKSGDLRGPCPAHTLFRDLEKAPGTAGTSRPAGLGPLKPGLTLLCVAEMGCWGQDVPHPCRSHEVGDMWCTPQEM